MECGIGKGSQLGAMALATSKKLWAVDSFQGIPLAGKKDTQQPGIGEITHDVNVPEAELLVTSGAAAYSVDTVKTHMKEWGFEQKNVQYVKGWFEHTVKDIKVEKLALLRLDGDLYSSTIVCLEHLYPKLVKGGYLIIDDFALTGCFRACQEYLGEDIKERVTVIEGGLGPVYIQK